MRGGADWLRRTGFSVVSVSQREFAGIPFGDSAGQV
jgi:hypothetical protein